MLTHKLFDALAWARSLQQSAPVSKHHERAVAELWPWLDGLDIQTALEIGAGEPPHLTARMLRNQGIACMTFDALPGSDVQGDCHDLPFPDNSFDLVIARHVLEHVLIPPLVLMEMARVSKRYLLVVVPWTSDKAIDWPDHLYVLPRRGWARLFDRLGLRMLAYLEGDHTEEFARREGLWEDKEYRYLLTKEGE